mmetsp:Transcript_7033/g.16084  ORF Transcript_7033/g.16084 Transcript_7033/m.16084 type:complete len:248 (-) Transcript_7033:1138-1881(-)|eukprot:CAMPEP_0116833054 /NCGR_PEP_ID=MMETSP0418-20121206/6225_1 /TAXON_ID=1158023 /ORGANISM="Astrosyne radiata, Strain 13vi08-1A" /LENGTH=247 /DNA_ID=CAMNT_0004462465 /DNA_START=37 /DNA_END=780 /DNA_ORIENTATION=-
MAQRREYGLEDSEEDDHEGDFWDEEMKETVEEDLKKKGRFSSASACCSYVQNCIRFYSPSGMFRSPREHGGEEVFPSQSDALEHEMMQHYRQLRMFSAFIAIISLIFWCWAIKNTMEMKEGQDLGMYSFLTTLLSSHWVLYVTRSGPPKTTSGASVVTSLQFRVGVTASHILVFLNYVLGVLFAITVGSKVYVQFALYCGIFSFLWLGAAVFGFLLLYRIRQVVLQIHRAAQEEEDFLNMEGAGEYF